MAELLRNHDTVCPAYHTKGRDLEDEPCTCGARVTSARDTATRLAAKLELLEEIRAEANERDRLNFHDFAFNLNYAFQAAEAKYRADGS